jgi:hypothetical protein
MIIFGLDGKERKWNPKGGCRDRKTSKLHQTAVKIVDRLLPHDTILEEVKLDGTKTERHGVLYLDIYLPLRRVAIEVQGQQHFEFNTFHYKNKMDFFRATARDRSKKNWCDINNIVLINLDYNEDEDEWTKRISRAIS